MVQKTATNLSDSKNSSLGENSNELLNLLLEKVTALGKSQKIINDLKKTIANLNTTILSLQTQLNYARRMRFGQSSEKQKRKNEGPGLFDDELTEDQKKEMDLKQKAVEKELISHASKKRRGRPRKDIMEGLPVEEIIIEPKDVDLSLYKKIGEEHTRIVEFIPAKLYVKDYIRPKYVLRSSIDVEHAPFIIAPVPDIPRYKGMVGSSLLAELLQEKYSFYIPFYRQTQQLNQLGIKLSRSTINDWYNGASELLAPLYELIKQEVLDSNYIQMDETVLPVIDKTKQKAAKRYLWAMRSPHKKLVAFDYDVGSRSKQSAVKILNGYEGFLQCDGYGVYDSLGQQYPNLTTLNCWAHVRRKIFDARNENHKVADHILDFIRQLYQVETKIKEQKLSPDEIAKERERLALPILDSLELYARETYETIDGRSGLGKAISYMITLYSKLKVYVHHGILDIDNNGVERTIRPITLARKNFLFCGNHKSAKQTAIMFTLINSCKDNKVNVLTWLTDVISRLPKMLREEIDLHDLLPTNYPQMV